MLNESFNKFRSYDTVERFSRDKYMLVLYHISYRPVNSDEVSKLQHSDYISKKARKIYVDLICESERGKKTNL